MLCWFQALLEEVPTGEGMGGADLNSQMTLKNMKSKVDDPKPQRQKLLLEAQLRTGNKMRLCLSFVSHVEP